MLDGIKYMAKGLHMGPIIGTYTSNVYTCVDQLAIANKYTFPHFNILYVPYPPLLSLDMGLAILFKHEPLYSYCLGLRNDRRLS